MGQRSNNSTARGPSALVDTVQERLEQLEFITEIQLNDGTWNANEGNLGIANGLLLAKAIMQGEEYKPLKRPRKWRSR